MKKVFIIAAVVLIGSNSLANYEMDKLMDSCVVAKAEANQPPYTAAEVKEKPYTIQVASYINEKDAVVHMEGLKLQEKDVKYFPAFVRGQVWYKVVVGRFETQAAAEKYREAFIKRMDEPFAVTISFLEHPTESDTTIAMKTVKPTDVLKQNKRKPASTTVIADKEKTVMPDESKAIDAARADAKAAPVEAKVKMMPKSSAGKMMASIPKSAMPSGEKIYTLQVGAYPSEKIAKENQAKWNMKDTEVFYKEAQVNGKTWYRLFVGKFKSQSEAVSFQKTKARGAESFIRQVTE